MPNSFGLRLASSFNFLNFRTPTQTASNPAQTNSPPTPSSTSAPTSYTSVQTISTPVPTVSSPDHTAPTPPTLTTQTSDYTTPNPDHTTTFTPSQPTSSAGEASSSPAQVPSTMTLACFTEAPTTSNRRALSPTTPSPDRTPSPPARTPSSHDRTPSPPARTLSPPARSPSTPTHNSSPAQTPPSPTSPRPPPHTTFTPTQTTFTLAPSATDSTAPTTSTSAQQPDSGAAAPATSAAAAGSLWGAQPVLSSFGQPSSSSFCFSMAAKPAGSAFSFRNMGGNFDAGSRPDRKDGPSLADSVVSIPPLCYVHVLDRNTNVTRVEVGPQVFRCKYSEKVVLDPNPMVVVPPQHHCLVQSPAVRGENGEMLRDASGQTRLWHADTEVRLHQDPFPLYPGEKLVSAVLPLRVVPPQQALRLRALRDFTDDGQVRVAGDQWLFRGPATYVPRPDVELVDEIGATVIGRNQALRLRARMETIDWEGQKRVAGEEWLVTRPGAYLPDVHEEVLGLVDAHPLTEKTALLVRARRTFTDRRGVNRRHDERWLVRLEDTETFIPDVCEEVVEAREATELTGRQYCIVSSAVGANGTPQNGRRKLVRGETAFFLQPGEKLECVRDNYILDKDEALVLLATEAFTDETVTPAVARQPGDRWMVRGPAALVPPLETEVEGTRHRAIPLDRTEGVYVRSRGTGEVRAVCGAPYMLAPDEELWKKQLPPSVLELLRAGDHRPPEDRTRVVTYHVPRDAAVRLFDYGGQQSRVVFGPDLVMLGPHEQFTQLSLSGGRPKQPDVIQTLSLRLGPEFCTDIVTVETSDRVRFSLQIAYHWHFDVGDKITEDASRIFNEPDFIGVMCRLMASRVRSTVARRLFEEFHKNADSIIQESVFGTDETGAVRDRYVFPQNNLTVKSVDVQRVEPEDQSVRESLRESARKVVRIATTSMEAVARHGAEGTEQEAHSRLQRQQSRDELEMKRARRQPAELMPAIADSVDNSRSGYLA